MKALFGLIIVVADIIAIIDLFRGSKDMGKKLLWLVLILIFPLVGMLVYFVFGKKK
jgi:hypothetical protein